MATVSLKHVQKTYPGASEPTVHDFCLDIADREFIVFVGPSGCGKSTTLRMVAGLEEITGGTVEIDGEVVNDLQPKDRGISMVFQNYALYPHLTVYENMAFPLRLLRGPKKMTNEQIQKTVFDTAKRLGIYEYLTRKPKNLSGGQRQRVAIGRAMVRESKVFLMDEPLSNLDAKLRNQMRAEIILLRKDIKSTFIYVTHDQTEAMTLGDRIVIMKDGYIMQVGTPEEVFDRPGNLFVAEFIGAPKMNTFLAKLVKVSDKEYYAEAFGTKIPITGPKAEELAAKGVEDQTIVLGVRPEHMAFSETPKEGYIPCDVVVNEMMGSELHLHVETPEVPEGFWGSLTEEDKKVRNYEKKFADELNLLPGGRKRLIVRIQTINLTEKQRAEFGPGKRLYLSAEPRVLHLFKYVKGERKDSLLYSAGPEAEISFAH